MLGRLGKRGGRGGTNEREKEHASRRAAKSGISLEKHGLVGKNLERVIDTTLHVGHQEAERKREKNTTTKRLSPAIKGMKEKGKMWKKNKSAKLPLLHSAGTLPERAMGSRPRMPSQGKNDISSHFHSARAKQKDRNVPDKKSTRRAHLATKDQKNES